LCKETRYEKFESFLVNASTGLIEKYFPVLAYILVLICLIIWIVFGFLPDAGIVYHKITSIENEIGKSFLNKDKTNMLITVGVFLVGFYVTVMSVLGSSYSAAMLKISEEGLSKKFVRCAVIAFFIGFVFLIFTVLYDLLKPNTFFTFFYLALIFSTLTEALRFSIIVMHIYYSNIKHASDEIKNKAQTEEKLMNLLILMESRLNDSKPLPKVDSDDYIQTLRKQIAQNEKAESKKDD
jgi:hypothetical protein